MFYPFFVWQNKILINVDPEDVMCLATEGNYTKVVLTNKNFYLVRSSLAAALKKLPPKMFIQTHRSYAVSIFFIDNISRDHLVIAGETIPIGKQYYNKVLNQLNIIE